MKIHISLSSKLERAEYTGQDGLYASILPDENTKKFAKEVADTLDIDLDVDNLHVTVMYSKERSGDFDDIRKNLDNIHSVPGFLIGIDTFTGHKGNNVVAFKVVSEELHRIHADLHKRGARHSFLPYMPHMTLANDKDMTDYKDTIREWNELMAEAPVKVTFHDFHIGDIA
jgi:2'-5' RNA ligase